MEIFKDEQALAGLLNNDKTIAVYVPVSVTSEISEKTDAFTNNVVEIQNSCQDERVVKTIAKIAEDPHPDLMYGSAILASTVINANDDVFLAEETWKARKTPIHTPFNDDHVENDIIGHIIAARSISKDGKVISSDEEESETPDYFDVEVDWVLYKSIFAKIAKEIALKAPKGEKFVSMECRFTGFDYALINKAGNTKIIARTENTAFLTKHLRAYGGTGSYNGYKVGRVLRNFRFSGMGNVDEPANKKSEYTRLENVDTSKGGVSDIDSFGELSKTFLYVEKDEIMLIENLDQAKAAITELEEKLAKLEADKKTEAEALAAKNEELTKALADTKLISDKAQSDLAAEKAKIEIVEQKLTEAQANLTATTKSVEAITAERDVVAKELGEIKSLAKVAERVAKLTELGIAVDETKRKKIADLTDDAFASVVEFAQAATKTEVKTVTTETTEVTKAAEKTLESAEVENKATVEATAGEQESAAEVYQKTAVKLAERVIASSRKANNKK